MASDPMQTIADIEDVAQEASKWGLRRKAGYKCSRRRLISASLAGISLIAGCGDASLGIKLAQAFGQTANTLEEQANSLAEDVYTSCLRGARYITIMPIATGKDSKDRRQGEEREDAMANCEKENRAAIQNLKAANGVIINYVRAIGRLAGDASISFRPEIETTATSLGALSKTAGININEATKSKGISIATFLVEMTSSRYRNTELAKAVICTQQPLKEYTEGLSKAYEEYYVNGLLETEGKMAKRYYAYLASIRSALEAQSKTPPSALEYETIDQNSYAAAIASMERRDAARRILRAMLLTAETNSTIASELQKSGYRISPSECRIFLKHPSSQTSVQLNTDQKERSSSEETRMKRAIAGRLSKYHDAMNNLLQDNHF